MYKLIKATPKHADKIIPFLTITCYWKEFVEGNTLNSTYEDFMLKWVVLDRLPLTTLLVEENDEDKVEGCIIAGTTEAFAKMPDYTPYLHPRVMEVFSPWFQFPVVDGVIIELIAVSPKLRGQGYGSKLYKVAEDIAKSENKECLSAFVWAFFPSSLITFTRKGFIITDCLHFPSPVDFSLLYLQKQPGYLKIKDYFQTQEYSDSKNLLLNTHGHLHEFHEISQQIS